MSKFTKVANFGKKLLKYYLIGSVFFIFLSIIFVIMIFIGAVDMGSGSGCLLRYASDGTNTSAGVSSSVTINADGNYRSIEVLRNGVTNIEKAPDAYGEWLNTSVIHKSGTTLETKYEINVKGSVRLCKSYFPGTGSRQIEVPLYGSDSYLYVPIFANHAKNTLGNLDSDSWQRVLKLDGGGTEQIAVYVMPPFYSPVDNSINSSRSSIKWYNSFTNRQETVNCNNNRIRNSDISPACNIYSHGRLYVASCNTVINNFPVGCKQHEERNRGSRFLHDNLGFPGGCAVPCDAGLGCGGKSGHISRASDGNPRYTANRGCGTAFKRNATCVKHSSNAGDNATTYTVYRNISINEGISGARLYGVTGTNEEVEDFLTKNYTFSSVAVNSNIPSIVYSNETHAMYYNNTLSNYLIPIEADCRNKEIRRRIAAGTYDNRLWLSYARGLLFKGGNMSSQLQVENLTRYRGIGGAEDIEYFTSMKSIDVSQVLMNDGRGFTDNYLKFKLFSNNTINHSNFRGGYLLAIQHTKCIRENGEGFRDFQTNVNKGALEYKWLESGIDGSRQNSQVRASGDVLKVEGKFTIPAPIDTDGDKLYTLWLRIKNNNQDYKDSEGQYNVEISGSVPVGSFHAKVINRLDLEVKRFISGIGIKLFESLTCINRDRSNCVSFFNLLKFLLSAYIIYNTINFILGRLEYSNQEFLTITIKILLVAGLMNENTYLFFAAYVYPLLTNFTDGIIANFSAHPNLPFLFLDDLLSYIIFSDLFKAQMFSLITNGAFGFIYMFLILMSCFVFCTAALGVITAYYMAKVLVAFMLGLAPIFIMMILFSQTESIFENWISTLFQYIIEPIIIFVGFTIIAHMFHFLLDKIIDFSVCFKCAIPIKIPVAFISKSLSDIYIFCMSWFAPWGSDLKLSVFAVSLSDVLLLKMISMFAVSYVSKSSVIAQSISGGKGSGAGAEGMSAAQSAVNKAKAPFKAVAGGAKMIKQNMTAKKDQSQANMFKNKTKERNLANKTSKDGASFKNPKK